MKLIIHDFDLLKEDSILAIRAGKWLLEHSEKPDAIISFGDGPTSFFAKRNPRGSITVRRVVSP